MFDNWFVELKGKKAENYKIILLNENGKEIPKASFTAQAEPRKDTPTIKPR